MKTVAIRLALLPLLLALACALAAGYGALHNQVSYSVAPGYFHEFKFAQFAVPQDLHNRLGAALVGVQASWWMGLVLGLPIWLAALRLQGSTAAFVRLFVQSAVLVVGVTLVFGFCALVLAIGSIGPNNLPWWMDGRAVPDPVAFAHAGTMHNASYDGGLVGALIGMIWAGFAVWRSRRI